MKRYEFKSTERPPPRLAFFLFCFSMPSFFFAHLSPFLSVSLSLSLQLTQATTNGVSAPVALAWTGERRVKKPKKKKLLAEAMAKAAAGGSASTAAAVAPTPTTTTSSAQLAASVYGEGARASVELRRERAIRLEEVQNLVLWVLGEGSSPRWAFVKVRREKKRRERREEALPLFLSLRHSHQLEPLNSYPILHHRTKP